MDEILVINNNSPMANYTVEFALKLAKKYSKNLVIANLAKTPKPVPIQQKIRQRMTTVGSDGSVRSMTEERSTASLNLPQLSGSDFQPELKQLDASAFCENDLVAYINKNRIYMIIQGSTKVITNQITNQRINIQTVINKVRCPVLLLPEYFSFKAIERIAYLADLRYSQLPVIKYLTQFKDASILLAHICEQGLPDLCPTYGNDLFLNVISRSVRYPELFFSHIKEKNIEQAVDTIINTMQADMLVCINRKFHFELLLGKYILAALPDHITVPLLVFPC